MHLSWLGARVKGMNPTLLADDDFYPLIEARHCDPFRILGLREFQGRWIGRVFRPDAAKVRMVDAEGKAFDLTRVHEAGLFEAVLPGSLLSGRM